MPCTDKLLSLLKIYVALSAAGATENLGLILAYPVLLYSTKIHLMMIM